MIDQAPEEPAQNRGPRNPDGTYLSGVALTQIVVGAATVGVNILQSRIPHVVRDILSEKDRFNQILLIAQSADPVTKEISFLNAAAAHLRFLASRLETVASAPRIILPASASHDAP